MCVMEIHAGAADATMAQAIWHNLNTVQSDCQMLQEIFNTRGDVTISDELEAVRYNLAMTLDRAFALFAMSVRKVKDHELSDHDYHGHERTFSDIAEHAAHNARPDYAR